MTEQQIAAVYDKYADGCDAAYYFGLQSGLNIAESIIFKVLHEVENESGTHTNLSSGTHTNLSAVLRKFFDATLSCSAKCQRDVDTILERFCEDCRDAIRKWDDFADDAGITGIGGKDNADITDNDIPF